MSTLQFESYTMPAATLGSENPLPVLESRPPAEPTCNPAAGEQFDTVYGSVRTCLPYRLQDGYNRTCEPRAFHAAVLENETLRATFLPELGGRLWSLRHKPTGRELLYVNPVFQPANLAIRNAWFSGGVEWNIGLIGHTPFTCSPLFTARASLDDGTPVLRMYEWERVRRTPFQLDAYLPDGSTMLLVRVRIVNPHDHAIPMYWWSNIAVDETLRTRVIVPADSAYHNSYSGRIDIRPIPNTLDTDISYPTNIGQSMDFFFRLPAGRRPWIAALDEMGSGLAQTSTARLRGRKLFLWGMGSGGRHWQEFLSVPERPYLEIQAGLARTQIEYLPMPARAEWTWLEAYGLVQADPKAVHGTEWPQAITAVEQQLEQQISTPELEAEFARGASMANRPPDDIVQHGSGWGTLEQRRRMHRGDTAMCSDALVFDDAALTDEQAPWLALLEHGVLPETPPSQPPGAWMVQPEWRVLLEASVQTGHGSHWLAWLHLGVMRCNAGDIAGARQAWTQSLALSPSAWALRNLAVLEQQAGRTAEAAEYWLAAHRLAPDELSLALECGQALLTANHARAWLDLFAILPPAIREHDRARYLTAMAQLAVGELTAVKSYLIDPLVADMREGEVSLTDLWFRLHEQQRAIDEGVPVDDALRERIRRECPPPAHIDFRMAM